MDLFPLTKAVFADRRALTPAYIPEQIQNRDKELKQMAALLGSAIEGISPSHILIYGFSGTGKTLCTRYVLDQLSKKADALIRYVVAGGTQYQVITMLAKACGVNVPVTGMSFLEVWEQLSDFLKGRMCIFVLDDFDKCAKKGCDDMMYYLSRSPSISTIALTNKVNVMEMIKDPRVLSSYDPVKMVFAPYDSDQICNILRYRAKIAFSSGVLSESVIPLCAATARRRGGDARYALDLLMHAGNACVSRGGDRVTDGDVGVAVDAIEQEFSKSNMMALSQSKQLLLWCALERQGISPIQLYKRYNELAEQYGVQMLSQTRLSALVGELEFAGFLEVTRTGKGRGRGVTWSVSPLPSVQVDMVREALSKIIF